MRLGFTCVSALVLAGCVSTESITGPQADFLALAPDAPAQWAAAGIDAAAPESDWLAQFEDATMIALINEALESNPTLEASAAAVRASRAALRSIDGRGQPQVGVSTSVGATSTSIEVLGNRDRVSDPSYGLGLDASWEADLWGRIDARVQASEQDLRASEADLAAARLAIAAQTAISWINLNQSLAQERVAVETYEARERTKLLTERRFERGLSTALDVRLARSALAGAEAAISARRQLSGNATRSLEVLLGRYPQNELDAPASIPTLAPLRAGGNPVTLLARRPDVAAAEARVAAAGFRAEQARLALLPSLRFSSSLSNNQTDFADAFDPALIAARALGSLARPVFDGGTLRAERDAAIARAEGTVAQYANTALTAWREVEDAIAADYLLSQQEDAQIRALEEARYAEDLAERQYSNGLVSIFNLIDAQTRRLTAESNLVSARAERAINRVRYHQALGGGLPGPIISDAGTTSGSSTQ